MSGVRCVVWDAWCEMTSVWDGWCEMNGVRWRRWVVYDGRRWVVRAEWWEMSGGRWVMRDEWWEMSVYVTCCMRWVRWVVWDVCLCDMLCERWMRWVVWDCGERWAMWDERIKMSGVRWVVWERLPRTAKAAWQEAINTKFFASPIGTPPIRFAHRRRQTRMQEAINAKFSSPIGTARTQFTHSRAPNPNARKPSTQNVRISYWRSYPEHSLHTAGRQTRMARKPSTFFFLRLPNGQYGPVSQLSRSEKCCTGPFNWGEAHCAGEKVKRKIGPFQRKSLWTKQEQQHNKGAQPATATRNPPARLPGARAEKTNHNKQETSKTNLGTP